ncbi:Golgi transport complex subunit 7 [Globomyces sp. JEL0801]|nr:Golgi transport complex subunit 7 [Globomyces sp. JEL0801]
MKEESVESLATRKIDAINNLTVNYELLKLEKSIQLQHLTTSAINRMPNILADMKKLQLQINDIHSLVASTKVSLNEKHSNDNVFESLVQLDRVASRMKATRSCLKDADNWSTVSAEMEALFVAKDYTKVAQRLEEADKSLSILSNVNDLNDRKELLQSLSDQFITLLKSDLMEAMSTNNLTDVKSLLSHLNTIHKSDEITNIYFDSLKSTLSEKWKVSQSAKDLLIDLKNYLTDLLTLFNNEKNRCQTIFGKDSNLQFNLVLKRLLQSLEPNLTNLLSLIDKSGNEASIVIFVQFYQIVLAFGSQFEKEYPVEQSNAKWSTELFQPFIYYQKKYDVYERKCLKSKSKLFTSDSQKLLMSSISTAELALNRFIQFTFCLPKSDIANLLDEFFSDVIHNFKNRNGIIKSDVDYLDQTELTESDLKLFQNCIDGLKQAVSFRQQLEEFWAKVDEGLNSPFAKGSIMAKSPPEICQTSVSSLSSLKGFAHKVGEKHSSIQQSFDLVYKNQEQVLHSILVPVTSILDKFTSMIEWSSTNGESQNVPQFSLSPLPYITCIGEYLLTLPQYFDSYSQEEFLKVFVNELPLLTKDDKEQSNDDDSSLDSEEVEDSINIWITSAVRITEDYYVKQILKLTTMTEQGRMQLIADITYLKNVMAAIEIDPTEPFSFVLTGLELTIEELTDFMEKHDHTVLKTIMSLRVKK